MDEKQILIKQPRDSGLYFSTAKDRLVLFLPSLVDVNYSFMYLDVVSNGRVSDGGIFKNSSLARSIGINMLNVPPDRVIVEGMDPLPYVMVAEGAFPLEKYLMMP